jgi:phage tail protein X
MTRYIEETTKPGDRWDLIAWRMYGDATRYQPILDANRHLLTGDPLPAIAPVLPAGLTLRIPILDAAPTGADAPPWRRG